MLAAEISETSRYYDQVVQYSPLPNDDGSLLDKLNARKKSVARDTLSVDETENRNLLLLNGNFNHDLDIEKLLRALKPSLKRESRVMALIYNPYFAWLYRAATVLGLRKGDVPETFLTRADLNNICRLAGFDVVRMRRVGFCPFKLFGIGDAINALAPLIPVINLFSLTHLVTLRPVIHSDAPSLTVVIPARNERGNIESALRRLPQIGRERLEVIFVEGHSSDDTWGEILRMKDQYAEKFDISAYQQTGRGKADAVRLGFSKAKGDLLTILDADLTMPPELLNRFYEAYCNGVADFINGSRLLYPMEGKAMKFLNRLGNIFFAKALSMVLGTPFSDSLCGTKLMSRDTYERFVAWRSDFGDFDPFGDFELLFPAATLGLGSVDVPIRYLDRTYGETNINRFRHGAMLLKMTLIGLTRITFGKTKV